MDIPEYVIEGVQVDEWRAGEARHESCQYGALWPGISMPARGPQVETPTLVPGCSYPIDGLPPWVNRQASGAVEFHRDCAACACFKPVGEEG